MSLYEIIKLKKCFQLRGTELYREKCFIERIVFWVKWKLKRTREKLK
jgi:hypothetical protein